MLSVRLFHSPLEQTLTSTGYSDDISVAVALSNSDPEQIQHLWYKHVGLLEASVHYLNECGGRAAHVLGVSWSQSTVWLAEVVTKSQRIGVLFVRRPDVKHELPMNESHDPSPQQSLPPIYSWHVGEDLHLVRVFKSFCWMLFKCVWGEKKQCFIFETVWKRFQWAEITNDFIEKLMTHPEGEGGPEKSANEVIRMILQSRISWLHLVCPSTDSTCNCSSSHS